ncbi:MAG: NAD(P)/FAD-dependent oxidoreductase [Lachnospiraceae bacterium]|nr:NAD(P)/FAD-dependent oxidoreductase [Lachnospiraceae bacterium]
MRKVSIIGGGASGMMSAILAGRAGHQVQLFEKNEKLGKKIFISGKGRCNLTNACEMEGLFQAVLTNARFLYSAFYHFNNEQTMAFFETCKVPLKIERGNRVFPASDHSSDVIAALKKEMERAGVQIFLHTAVKDVLYEDGTIVGLELENQKKIFSDAVIVATGGMSYPSTGSTGDGYFFAKKAGHTITELYPALVPMEVKEDYIKELQGLSLRNVQVSIFENKKKRYTEFGEMLFTHYGVSGPVVLSASSVIGKRLKHGELTMQIDLKPALTFEQLDDRLLREFSGAKNKQFKNAIGKLFPSKLIPVILKLSQIDVEKQVNAITKEERHGFVGLMKGFPLTLIGLRSFNEAIITKGGVNVKEIDPGTMESKLVSGLYFVGEVLDLDGVTGGFNLQIAWSTGYLAGERVG